MNYQKEGIPLEKYGIRTKSNKKRKFSLKRYREIPLHAMFLYTSEDRFVHQYLKDNWGAIDTLSGNFCDIHPTFDQFDSMEDAYDFIDKLDIIKNSNFNELSKLPGLFFWNLKSESAFVSLSEAQTEYDIKKVIRATFQEIRLKPKIETILNLPGDIQNNYKEKHNSLLKDIFPFLIIFLVVILTIAFLSTIVRPVLLGIVLIGAIIFFIIIGSFLFRYKDQISEKTLKSILSLVIKKMSILKGYPSKKEKK